MALCGVELEMVPVRRARAALSFFCSVTMDFAFLYHHYNHAQYTLLFRNDLDFKYFTCVGTYGRWTLPISPLFHLIVQT